MTDACIVEITNDVFVLISLEGSAAPAAVWPNSFKAKAKARSLKAKTKPKARDQG